MTYRTGNHWGVTIVREGTEPLDAEGHHPDAELVAVVTNGDQKLAELICALLNGVERQRAMVRHGRELLGDSADALRAEAGDLDALVERIEKESR
jgi:hypothetical protein